MQKFFKSLLASTSNSLSMKRFCGLFGWLVLMGCLAWNSYKGTEMPGVTTEFIFGTVTLLGVDSVTSIWKESGSTSRSKAPKRPGGSGGSHPKVAPKKRRETALEDLLPEEGIVPTEGEPEVTIIDN